MEVTKAKHEHSFLEWNVKSPDLLRDTSRIIQKIFQETFIVNG